MLKLFKNVLPIFGFSYKFVLKSVKILNQISWAMESWLKTLKCQIWLTNTKPFFWENEANVETLQKSSPYIWVFYKFVLKSVKNSKSNLMSFGILVQGFKMPVLIDKYKTIFLEKRGKRWNSSKTFSLYLGFL